MERELVESYLENISELVEDEDKIVTYKLLSRSLGIHVNTAKQLLYTYLTQRKAENTFPISATYLLAGKLKDGSFNIAIINESELESTYQKFVEITSEHVYSVQKGKHVREVNMLCGVDKGAQESPRLVITSSRCKLKCKDEVKKKPESNQKENKEAIEKAFGCEKEKVCLEESNKRVESPKKREVVKSPKKVSPKKQKEKSQGNVKKTGGSIANLFAKAAQKNATRGEPEAKISFFDKEVEVNKCEKAMEVSPNASSKAEEKNGEKSVIPGADEKDENNLFEDFEGLECKRSKKNSSKKKRGSKRKRIQVDDDSSDSESNGEEEPPQTPVEEIEVNSLPPSAALEDDEDATESQAPNKRKKRKIVDKTVMQEDGYLETRKEVVFEVDSDDAEEEPKKIKEKAKPGASNGAKKQSSLLTFFKKN